MTLDLLGDLPQVNADPEPLAAGAMLLRGWATGAPLAHGDVVVWGAPPRLSYHGVLCP
jgi:hypothetical protein